MQTDLNELETLRKQVKQLHDKLRKQTHLANLYAWLHDKEILLATPEGFKHFNHGELTEYIKAEMAKDWGLSEEDIYNFSKGVKRNGNDTGKES